MANVNDPVLDVRKVMMKLEKKRIENEMKKMSEKKRKLEREEADRLESQKKARGAKMEEEKENHLITHSITITQLSRLYP